MAYGYKFNASQVESIFLAGGAGGVMRYAEQSPFSTYNNVISNSPTTSDINDIATASWGGTTETLIVCQDGSAYSTTNAGVSWRTETTGTTEALYSAVYILGSSPYWFIVGANGTIRRKYFNATNAWISSSTGAPAVAINKIYNFNGTLVAGASGTGTSIIKSTDAGVTWSSAGTLSINDGEMVTNIVSNGSTYVAATDTGIYSNTALTGTWTRRATGTAPFSVHYSSKTGKFHAFSWAPTTWSSDRGGYSSDGISWSSFLHYYPSRTIAGEPRKAVLDNNDWPYWITDKGYSLYAPNAIATHVQYLNNFINTPTGVNASNTGNGRHCGVALTTFGSRTRTITVDSDSLVPGLWVNRKFTSTVDPVYVNPQDIIYNGSSVFTIYGEPKNLAFSLDGGVVWDRGLEGGFDIAYGETVDDAVWVPAISKFLALGHSSVNGNYSYTSADGQTWGYRTYTGGKIGYRYMACDGNSLVMIKTADDRIIIRNYTAAGLQNQYYEYESYPNIAPAGIYKLQYLSNRFYGITGWGLKYTTSYSSTSADTTWADAVITPSLASTKYDYSNIAYNGTTYVCWAQKGVVISWGSDSQSLYLLTSTDGINWTASNPGTPFTGIEGMYSVAWSSTLNMFAAVGTKGNIFTSTTGLPGSWTKRSSPAITTTGRYLSTVRWVGDRFIAVGNYSQMFSSSDGVTWVTRSTLSLSLSDVYLPVSVMIRPFSQYGAATLYGRTMSYTLEHDQNTGIGFLKVDNASGCDILVLAV